MLLCMELKKIWKPKILFVIVLIGLLCGYLQLEFPLKYFPNGHPQKEQYQLMLEWTEKYGITMEEEERLAAEEPLTLLKEQARVLEERDAPIGEDDVRYQAEALEGALFAYDIRYQHYDVDLENCTFAQQKRLRTLYDEKKLDGLLPYEIMENAQQYWRWGAMLLILNVLVLLAPVITRDTLTDMKRLQYTSRQGRNILRTQFGAMLLSAGGIVVLELLVLGWLYAGLGTWRFWKNPINSFFYGEAYWFDLNFGQYLLFILLIMVLYAGGTAGIAFFISCSSKNYISLVLKMIPVLFFVGMLADVSIEGLFSFSNPLNRFTGIAGIEVWCGILVFLVGMVLGGLAYRRLTRMRDFTEGI